jgi:hypothetical protein
MSTVPLPDVRVGKCKDCGSGVYSRFMTVVRSDASESTQRQVWWCVGSPCRHSSMEVMDENAPQDIAGTFGTAPRWVDIL